MDRHRLFAISLLVIAGPGCVAAHALSANVEEPDTGRTTVFDPLPGEESSLAQVIAVGHSHEALRRIRAGANVNAPDGENGPLTCAAESFRDDMLPVIRLLIDKGARIEHRGLGGATPLMFACESGKIEYVEYLVANGANVSAKDDSGWTALHYAAGSPIQYPEDRAERIIKLLVERGADINAKSQERTSPLDEAKDAAATGDLWPKDYRVNVLLKLGAKSATD